MEPHVVPVDSQKFAKDYKSFTRKQEIKKILNLLWAMWCASPIIFLAVIFFGEMSIVARNVWLVFWLTSEVTVFLKLRQVTKENRELTQQLEQARQGLLAETESRVELLEGQQEGFDHRLQQLRDFFGEKNVKRGRCMALAIVLLKKMEHKKGDAKIGEARSILEYLLSLMIEGEETRKSALYDAAEDLEAENRVPFQDRLKNGTKAAVKPSSVPLHVVEAEPK